PCPAWGTWAVAPWRRPQPGRVGTEPPGPPTWWRVAIDPVASHPSRPIADGHCVARDSESRRRSLNLRTGDGPPRCDPTPHSSTNLEQIDAGPYQPPPPRAPTRSRVSGLVARSAPDEIDDASQDKQR